MAIQVGKLSQVQAELEILEKAIYTHGDLIGLLEDRLVRVIRTVDEIQNCKEPVPEPVPELVPLADYLLNLTLAVIGQTSNLQSILDRLEL